MFKKLVVEIAFALAVVVVYEEVGLVPAAFVFGIAVVVLCVKEKDNG